MIITNLMVISAEVVFICVIGIPGIISVDARQLLFRKTKIHAKKVPSDCSECGISIRNPQWLIRGGSRVNSPSTYPWMVSLSSSKRYNVCNGAIIDAFHILTAAHCFEDEKEKLEVYFQTSDRKKLSHGYAIEKVFTHPRFALNKSETSDKVFGQNDIALVKLKQKIKCNEYKNPICLPDADFKLSLGARSIIAGWGSTDQKKNSQTKVLHDGSNKNLDFEECIKEVPETKKLKDFLLCQGCTESAPCFGDSGGPLMHKTKQKYYVVGITSSTTNDDCSPRKPAIYTNVAKYLDWIKKNKKSSSFSGGGMANAIKEIRTCNQLVVNGDDVRPPYKYPWMVQIHINGGACAGAIISEYYVLTATHCVIKKRKPLEFVDPKDVVVNFVTSTYDVRKGPPVQKVIPHHQYEAFVKHDIALLKFKEKITRDRFTTPICLPPTNFVLRKGAIVTGSGWGVSATGNQKSSDDKLKEGKFMVETINACPHNPGSKMVKESFYCLKGIKKQMACSGDSGGPAFYEHEKKFYVIGVQSFGFGCDVKKPFNYVTSVPHHLSWIKENMK